MRERTERWVANGSAVPETGRRALAVPTIRRAQAGAETDVLVR